jgi:uncharacterized protein
MKLLLVLAALAVGLWLWRSGRPSVGKPNETPPRQAQTMFACALCQVHVPQADALVGKRGYYCCEQHRQQAES